MRYGQIFSEFLKRCRKTKATNLWSLLLQGSQNFGTTRTWLLNLFFEIFWGNYFAYRCENFKWNQIFDKYIRFFHTLEVGLKKVAAPDDFNLFRFQMAISTYIYNISSHKMKNDHLTHFLNWQCGDWTKSHRFING